MLRKSLEDYLDGELDLTAGGGCRDDAGGGAQNCGCGLAGRWALSGAVREDDFVRCLQVRVIENVEELGTELEAGPLGQQSGL